MRWTAILYGAVGSAAVVAGILIPWLVHSQGSAGIPGWQGLVSPGPLSHAHGFLAGECEACHVPHEGVEPKQCLTCHAPTSFTANASTRFHAEATACATCHVEHLGRSSPTRMEHVALLDGSAWTPVRKPREGAGLAWRIKGFQHPPGSSTECAECHRPPPSHAMMHFEMVSQRLPDGRRASTSASRAIPRTTGTTFAASAATIITSDRPRRPSGRSAQDWVAAVWPHM